MARNILQYTDLYKPTMHCQYPEGVTEVHSYIESRSGGKFDHILFNGVQAFVKEWLLNPITRHDVDEMEDIYTSAFNGYKNGFNRSVFDHVVNKHGGFLPLEICALPEGLVVPTGLPLATVRNTDPLARSITTYIEPAILPATWYASTVATISQRIRTLIAGYMQLTCDNLDGLPFKLHDFGVRGASSFDSAAIGGVGHLISFLGTDNVPALFHARKYYGSNCVGFSIPAMEHSTVTSWGRAGESAAYANNLSRHKGAGMVACVMDSYDQRSALSEILGGTMKQEIIDSGVKFIARLDSGDPVVEVIEALNRLDACFGHTVNSKGFKVLNNVGILQGDGVDEESIGAILSSLLKSGFSVDNIAFGMGGALLQHCDRDWGRWAMKCSEVTFEDGTTRGVAKDPVTDPGKKSKVGKFLVGRRTVRHPESYHTGESSYFYKALLPGSTEPNLLQPVYRNGELLRDLTLEEIRENSRRS